MIKDQWGGISVIRASNMSVRTLMSNQTFVSAFHTVRHSNYSRKTRTPNNESPCYTRGNPAPESGKHRIITVLVPLLLLEIEISAFYEMPIKFLFHRLA